MGMITKRVKKCNRAKSLLNELYQSQDNVIIIHYSCENFYEIKEGRTPRITSIALKFLKSGQTQSFSIHKVAEKEDIEFYEITENYDLLEKNMLDDYFKFIKDHKHCKYIHWGMRNVNYGFQAIEHRYEVLKGTPFILDDIMKYDLSKILKSRFSEKYSDHPRLPKIIETNAIAPKNFLSGAEEAQAFDNKEYVKLHQSTLSKVDVFDEILIKSVEGSLKTKATWKDIYGISPQGIFELTKENWIAGVIYALFWVLVGILIRNYLLVL